MKLAALKRFRYRALILFGAFLAHAATDVWWHDSGRQRYVAFFGLQPVDPFSPAARTHEVPLASHVQRLLDSSVFPDWKHEYRRATSPFRPRNDPKGNAYFPDSFPGGYTNDYSLFSLSGYLRNLEEPSLFEGNLGDEAGTVFRLSIVRNRAPSFTSRIERNPDGTIAARAMMVDPDTGERIADHQFPFPEDAWSELESIITEPDFWTPWTATEWIMVSDDFHAAISDANWILEARIDGRYEILPAGSLVQFATTFELISQSDLRVRDLHPYARTRDIVSDVLPGPPLFEIPWWQAPRPIDFKESPSPVESSGPSSLLP